MFVAGLFIKTWKQSECLSNGRMDKEDVMYKGKLFSHIKEGGLHFYPKCLFPENGTTWANEM